MKVLYMLPQLVAKQTQVAGSASKVVVLQAPAKQPQQPNAPAPIDPNPGVFKVGSQGILNLQNLTDDFYADFANDEDGCVYKITIEKVIATVPAE